MDINVKEEINDSKTVELNKQGQDLSQENIEVIKTENIKNEVTDIDSSPTIRVSNGTEYIPVNKVGLESIKYEEDVKEEKIAPYNTGLNIKTELSDREDQIDIRHDLSYEDLESVKFEDRKLDCGNEYMEHTNARCYVLSYKSDHHKQYVNDIGTIKCRENVENKSFGGNVKKCLVQQCEVHHKKTELYQSHLCDIKVKSKHRLLLNDTSINDDSAEIFHCELCDLKTKFKHNLLKHYILKHDSSAEIFHCDLCNFKTKLISYLREHHRLKHDNSAEIFTCERCDFKTKNKSCYLRHHRLKHVEAPEIFHCEMCHFETKYKDNLLKHYRSKHDDRPKYFCCELCDFKTKRKYCLVRHCKAKHSD